MAFVHASSIDYINLARDLAVSGGVCEGTVSARSPGLQCLRGEQVSDADRIGTLGNLMRDPEGQQR